jgi:hypothetical protein
VAPIRIDQPRTPTMTAAEGNPCWTEVSHDRICGANIFSRRP